MSRLIFKKENKKHRQSITGTTVEDHTGHVHEYVIDPHTGNGWTYDAVHPENNKVKHKHRIEKFVVSISKSSCHPNCEGMYGVKGIGIHSHKIEINNNSVYYKED